MSSSLRASFTITYTPETPCLSILYFNLSARIAFISHAVIYALLFEIAAICVVLLPGAAAISKIFSFSCGSRIIGGNIEERLCKYISPFSYILKPLRSFSFAFFIINASLYHGTVSNSIFFSLNTFATSSRLLFTVFTLHVTALFPLYPLNTLLVISSPY